METNARYQPVSLPEFKLRSGSLKWSLNLKDLASHYEDQTSGTRTFVRILHEIVRTETSSWGTLEQDPA